MTMSRITSTRDNINVVVPFGLVLLKIEWAFTFFKIKISGSTRRMFIETNAAFDSNKLKPDYDDYNVKLHFLLLLAMELRKLLSNQEPANVN